jgi:hypothetical protein
VFWKRCSTCKKEIGFGALHYVCSVSTCNRKGTDFIFCSTDCWDAHVPTFRHRDAWAEERRAPRAGSSEAQPPPRSAPPSASSASASPPRPSSPMARPLATPSAGFVDPAQPVAEPPRPEPVLHDRARIPREILVVASKLKAYIRARSDMNTSEAVLEVLSERLRDLCDGAIHHAAASGRKTVMDRDF